MIDSVVMINLEQFQPKMLRLALLEVYHVEDFQPMAFQQDFPWTDVMCQFLGCNSFVEYEQNTAILSLVELCQVLQGERFVFNWMDLDNHPGIFTHPGGVVV